MLCSKLKDRIAPRLAKIMTAGYPFCFGDGVSPEKGIGTRG